MSGSLGSHQLPAQTTPAHASLRVKNRERKSEDEENPSQPAGNLRQYVRGLGAENVFGHDPAEGRTQAFAFWSLHQNDQNH